MAVSFVYDVNSKEGRAPLWDELNHVALDTRISALPWVVLGDFNQSLNPPDSSKTSSRVTRRMSDFRGCLDSTGLSDLTYRGNQYTWWNNWVASGLKSWIESRSTTGGCSLSLSPMLTLVKTCSRIIARIVFIYRGPKLLQTCLLSFLTSWPITRPSYHGSLRPGKTSGSVVIKCSLL